MNPEQIDLPTICKHGLELRHCPLCVWPYEENTMKTPEQINRLIAEKCMGWHREGPWWKEEVPHGTVPRYAIDFFHPYHRIEHAHMALEKFEVWLLEKLDGKVVCRIIYRYTKDGIGYWSRGTAATPSAAISEAIVAAVEGKQ